MSNYMILSKTGRVLFRSNSEIAIRSKWLDVKDRQKLGLKLVCVLDEVFDENNVGTFIPEVELPKVESAKPNYKKLKKLWGLDHLAKLK